MGDRLIRIVSNEELDKPLAKWAKERITELNGLPEDAFGRCKCAGIFRDGLLKASCVYYGYVPEFGTIQMALAADDASWCNRGVLATLLEYPFRIGLRRIWVLTRADNKRIIRLLEWIGFKKEGTMGEFFGPGITAVSWRLLKADYDKFLKRIGRDERRRQGSQRTEGPVHGAAA